MKRFIKSLVVVAFLFGTFVPAWSQTPSTEGKDFWVTFLRADDNNPTGLKLIISANKTCSVTISNPTTGYSQSMQVTGGSSLMHVVDKAHCYSSSSEQKTTTALHVTATEDISLFAGNYRTKSFDAANILPTKALLDDYLIQAYPPSDHENNPQGSHFAIVAVENNTVVDYVIPTGVTTEGSKSGSLSTPTLNKGDVWYVWTGKKEGNAGDISGTTVKARNGKKIAVFQGCPHTNVPDKVRNRDHIFSQAMPTAYWGTEFGITSSLLRRRDIIAVMAINDGTEVYINDEDGEKHLVHTFKFDSSDPQERKHYWTFEIGEMTAYCNSSESPHNGKLPEPLIIDSSCYLTTSCPAGVHLIMASNRYDLPEQNSPEPDSDPALLWVSPIEQVIKNINFSTYDEGINTHYVNIVTQATGTTDIELDGNKITSYFHPITGNSDYSYARVPISAGGHNINGTMGFVAHVYGYGDKASYAYSCGSSTIQRGIAFNNLPLFLDTINAQTFCVNDEIEMKLNIGSNEYETVVWDFGDGITYSPGDVSNDEKKKAYHTYSTPGWYDLKVTAVYENACTHKKNKEDLKLSFRVVRPDTIFVDPTAPECIDSTEYKTDPAKYDKLFAEGENDTLWNERVNCYDPVKIRRKLYGLITESEYEDEGRDSALVNGVWYYTSQDVSYTIKNTRGCDSIITCHLTVITCLGMNFPGSSDTLNACLGDGLAVDYTKTKGDLGEVRMTIPGVLDEIVEMGNENTDSGILTLPTYKIAKPGHYKATLSIEDQWCDDLSIPLSIDIYYPSDIFKYKFNNVLAVYKPGYGGNKDLRAEFTAYQWYFNDQPIAGATGSVYHTDEQMPAGSYYVELTDNSGMTLRSCAQDVAEKEMSAQEPARKLIYNGQMCIQIGENIYDIYGQRVK